MWLDEKKREGGMKKRERRKLNCTKMEKGKKGREQDNR